MILNDRPQKALLFHEDKPVSFVDHLTLWPRDPLGFDLRSGTEATFALKCFYLLCRSHSGNSTEIPFKPQNRVEIIKLLNES